MRRNKGKITWIISATLIIAITLVVTKIANDSAETNRADFNIVVDNLQTIDLTQIKSDDKNLMIDTMYLDGCYSIDEMVQNADVIVKGTAGEIISEKMLGVFISFNVEEVVKGNLENESTLTVVQLKDGNELAEGKSYVLALGKDQYYDENTYHVIGGCQGIFSTEGEKLYNKDEIFQDELQQFMTNDSVSSGINERDSTNYYLDKLLQHLSDRVKIHDIKN